MNINTVFFSATDGVKLNGIIYKSSKETKKLLISVHGMQTNFLKRRDEKIAEAVNNKEIDLFAFNNRGHDLSNYIKKENKEKELAGTSYEEISECYEDILGAINYAEENNYEDIYLMGHSLGSTKVIYFYNRLLKESNESVKKIKAVLLLSLVDIPFAIRVYLQDKFQSLVTYAKNMKKEGMENILMPDNSFIVPISVKTFLRYSIENEDINFAQFSNERYEFNELNNIQVPLFMRWGNQRELIAQQASDLCEFLRTKITNTNLDIDFIDGADHSYTEKEENLANEIVKFLAKNLNL